MGPQVYLQNGEDTTLRNNELHIVDTNSNAQSGIQLTNNTTRNRLNINNVKTKHKTSSIMNQNKLMPNTNN